MAHLTEPRLVQTSSLSGSGAHYRRRERADQLATVLRIIHQMSRIRALDTLLETLAEEIHVSLGYASVHIFLTEGTRLVLRAAASITGFEPHGEHPFSGSSPAALACQQSCLIFSDTFAEQASISTYPNEAVACASIPLISNRQAIGAIEILTDDFTRWRSADIEALMALAKQSAMIIETSQRNSTEFDQLYAALQSRADQLTLVNEISTVVSANLDEHAAFQSIVTQMPRAVPCQGVSLANYDAERQILTLRALWFMGAKTTIDIGSELRLEDTEARFAIESGLLHYVSDLSLSPTAYSHRLLNNEYLRSLVHVPIMSGDECLGVLSLMRSEPNSFTGVDLALLNSLSPHIATAFHNASLYAQAQQAYSELAMAQEHTLQTERLRAIGEMASGVAHDFNNLLAIILGHMELMKSGDPGQAERSRRAVIQAAQDGAQTVRRIQEFVRTNPELHSTYVNLAELGDDVVQLTRPRWHSDMIGKGVVIDVRCDLRPVPNVLGNSTELREVVTNLILNAVDAMPHGGALLLRSGVDGDMIWLEVADTGHGIPPEVCARIFEPFYTTKANRGTGLGLAVSRSIALRHNGELTVESEPGRGSRFRLSVPAAEAPPETEQVAMANIALQSLNILLVEDDAGVRDTMAQLLRLDDHNVDCAANGRSALEQFAPGKYDVVISDLGMPDMTGWEVLAAVRAADSTTTTILASGWGAQLDPHDARVRGVDHIVPKPIDVKALNAALAAAQRIR